MRNFQGFSFEVKGIAYLLFYNLLNFIIFYKFINAVLICLIFL